MLSISRKTANDVLSLESGPSKPQADEGGPTTCASWDLKAVGVFNNFMTQLSDSTMLPAYLAGGLAYRVLRLGAVGNWVASPAVKTLSSLFARQVGASTLALGGEVAAFTGAHRIARGLVQNAGGKLPIVKALGTEAAETALMLASLRSFGFGFGMIGGLLQRAGLGGAATQGMLSTLGSYTGLLTAEQAEHHLLHPEIPATGNPWLSTGVSLLHFIGFGMVARNLTPRRWKLLEEGLEQKTHSLIQQGILEIRQGLTPNLGAHELVWQTTGVPFPPHGSALPATPSTISYSRPSSRPNLVEFVAKLSPRQRGLVANLSQNLAVSGGRLSDTLAQSELIGTDPFDLALRRLHHVTVYTPREGARSSYINWITRLGFERIVEQGDGAGVDQMITLITQATPRPEYEAFLSRYFPEAHLPPPPPPSRRFSWDLLKRKNPTLKNIEALPVSDLAKTTLRRWFSAQSRGDSSAPFFIPEGKFLHLLEYLKKMKDPLKWKIAEVVLERAGSNPMGLVKLHRLYQILNSEMEYDSGLKNYTARGFLGTKLRELVDDKFRFAPEIPEIPHKRSNFRYGAPGGHLGNHGPKDLLRPMLTQLPDLLDPVKEQTRSTRRRKVLAQFLDQHPGDQGYTQENLAEAFQQLHQNFGKENYPIEIDGEKGDFSLHIARQLADKSVRVEALPDGAYQARYHEIQRALAEKNKLPYQEKSVDHTAYFFDFGDKSKILGLEKPTILMKINGQNSKSTKQAADLYFEDLKAIVHEWMHSVQFRRFSQGAARTWNEGAQLKQEAATHTAADWFGAQHGDVSELRHLTTEGLGGYMMRFLDHYESFYKKFWRE